MPRFKYDDFRPTYGGNSEDELETDIGSDDEEIDFDTFLSTIDDDSNVEEEEDDYHPSESQKKQSLSQIKSTKSPNYNSPRISSANSSPQLSNANNRPKSLNRYEHPVYSKPKTSGILNPYKDQYEGYIVPPPRWPLIKSSLNPTTAQTPKTRDILTDRLAFNRLSVWKNQEQFAAVANYIFLRDRFRVFEKILNSRSISAGATLTPQYLDPTRAFNYPKPDKSNTALSHKEKAILETHAKSLKIAPSKSTLSVLSATYKGPWKPIGSKKRERGDTGVANSSKQQRTNQDS